MSMRSVVITLVVLAVSVPVAYAQTPPKTPAAARPAPSAKAPAAKSANPLSDALRDQWNGTKKNIQESAEQMPEENYAFKPVDTVRTFGQILAHVAGASYVFCSAAKAEKSGVAENDFEKTATTKAAILKATTDAIAYCDGAFKALTDATAAQMVEGPFGGGSTPRAGVLIAQIGHDNEHYGNLVTYFRIKGMVPPSSRR
jgi:uncharacterized damage-inducible protein DinB